MRKSSTPPPPLSISPQLTSIRPSQKWQYSAVGGSAPFSFDLQSGSGSITSAGRFTAGSATGSTIVRVTDSLSSQATSTVATALSTVTMTTTSLNIVGDSHGMIVDSGGAGGNYAANEYSYILLRSDKAGSSITLTFDAFGTESGYDFLRVYNGTSASGTPLGSFSGSTLPGTVTATSGAMLITWSSDGPPQGIGYQARWSITPASLSLIHPSAFAVDAGSDEKLTAVSGVGPFTFSIVSGSGSITTSASDPFVGVLHTPAAPGTTVVRVTDALGSTYDESINIGTTYTNCTDTSSTSSIGVLYDQGGPTGDYASNLNCGFLINPASPGTGIELKLDYLQSEAGYDKLFVYDGADTSGTLLATYHGLFPATTTLTATSGKMYLRFSSDGSPNGKGFRAVWRVLP